MPSLSRLTRFLRFLAVTNKRSLTMENAIYWHGRQVGIEINGRITWFPSAPREAVDAYGH